MWCPRAHLGIYRDMYIIIPVRVLIRRIIPPSHTVSLRNKIKRIASVSILAWVSRRPPLGSGSFFQADDEDGEMFSNSYLTDLKDGRCNADPSRLSELARRNTMVLPHLKSSYPAETQFYKKDEFRDRDLQQGTLKDVSLITGTLA